MAGVGLSDPKVHKCSVGGGKCLERGFVVVYCSCSVIVDGEDFVRLWGGEGGFSCIGAMGRRDAG